MIVGASIVAVQSILYTEWDRRTIKLTTTTDITWCNQICHKMCINKLIENAHHAGTIKKVTCPLQSKFIQHFN